MMTDEVKPIVNVLRECAVATPCSKCFVFCGNDECFFTATAKAIESLAAELEQVKRERNAAVAIMAEKPSCETCAHYMPGYFCPGCRNKSNWQFCGVMR